MSTCEKAVAASVIVAVLGSAILATAEEGKIGSSPDSAATLRDMTLVGSTVLDAKSQKLGEIKNVLLDPQTGQATFVMIDAAGGAEHAIYVVPYAALRVTSNPAENRQSVMLNRQPEQLRNAPQIQNSRWELLRDARFLDQVRNFYQVTAYYTARPIDNAIMPPGAPTTPATSVPPSLPAPAPCFLIQPGANSGLTDYQKDFYDE